jgi:putative intracellular protease/amidase
MKVLIVLTSHGDLGKTKDKTGFWIDEFATPYYVLYDGGAEIVVASPKGGQLPVDPKSELAEAQSFATARFYTDNVLIDKVAHSLKLSEVNEDDFDGIFYAGGHGPLWDLTDDTASIKLIEAFYKNDKPLAFVCHAPAALLNANNAEGVALVKGKYVTSFSNTEEKSLKLNKIVPYSLETELTTKGAKYSKGKDWESHTEQDGYLITGQNPASSAAVAELLLSALKPEFD